MLVFVHEFGHYWVARRHGVHVEVFSIGLGPEIWGRYDRHGTRWKIAWIPLGGYVRMFSDANAASTVDREALTHMSDEDKRKAYHAKTPWQKIQVAAAGPLANYILAIILLTGTFVIVGEKIINNTTVIGAVHEDSAAEKSGLKAGDKIIAVNKQKVTSFQDIAQNTRSLPGKSVEFDVVRKDTAQTIIARLDVLKVREDGQEKEVGILGVEPSWFYQKHGVAKAFALSILKTLQVSWMSLKALSQMVTGNRSTKDLMGPLGIAKNVAVFAKNDFQSLIYVTALLSIGLGFINLLPIPLMDGGQIVTHAIEGIRGRPMSEKLQEIISFVGLGIVLMLFMISTWNDIGRFAWVKKFWN